MTTHVIMNVDRPNGSGGTYKAGVEYDLPDDLVEFWRGMGICKRTNIKSEQSGSTMLVDRLLQRCGVVGSLAVDDASNLQEAILRARVDLKGAMILPIDFRELKLNSGITIDVTADDFRGSVPIITDITGMAANSGAALNLDGGSVADGNLVPLHSIHREIGNLRLIGTGSPTTPGTPGVVGMKVRGVVSKAYLAAIRKMSFEGLETSIDLGGNEFGTSFKRISIRPAAGGVGIRSLTGDGTDYGERWNFEELFTYNATNATGIVNSTTSATIRVFNSSLDYNKTQIDVSGGRVSLHNVHIETNKDEDYLFKVSGNEATGLSISQSEIVLNNMNRTNFHLFDIADSVILGGIVVRDTPIFHNAGYSLPTYVNGKGRAVMYFTMGFTAQPKVPFSEAMNSLRADFADGYALQQWSLSGSVLPKLGTIGVGDSVSLEFPAAADATTAEILIPIQPTQLLRMGYQYRKQASSTGKAKLQIVVSWLDSMGNTIGSSPTVKDQDGNTEWTNQHAGPSVCAPAGTRNARVRIIKSADADATGRIWLDKLVIHPV